MVSCTTFALLLALAAVGHAQQGKVRAKQACEAPRDLDPNAASTTLGADSCPMPAVASCGMFAQNSCCTEANGLFSLTQQWNWDKVIGGEKDWGIHGLWPDCCDLSFPSSCDPSRAGTEKELAATLRTAPDVLKAMNIYWQSYKKVGTFGRIKGKVEGQWKKWTDKAKTTIGRPTDPTPINSYDLSFWYHEWEKHGTCVTTLNPKCAGMSGAGADVVSYFTAAIDLYKKTPTYEWLSESNIEPGAAYKLSDVTKALGDKWGAVPLISCDKQNRINEVYYFFHAVGSIRFGNLKPVDSLKQQCKPNNVWYCTKGDNQCGLRGSRGASSDEI